MADVRPSGATRDAQYGFSKVFVHDLDAMAAFYQEVFGLVDVSRCQPLERRAIAFARLLRLGHERVAVRGEPQRGAGLRELDGQDPSFDRRHASGAEIGIEAMGQVVPDRPGMHAFDLTGSPATIPSARLAMTMPVSRCRLGRSQFTTT